VHAKSVSGFVIVGSVGIVIEHPSSVLGAAGLVDEPSDLFIRDGLAYATHTRNA
jgi:hypothetical protein